MRLPSHLVFLAVFAIGLMSNGCGGAAAQSRDDGVRRYYDGQSFVEVQVMLDRLHLERAGGEGAPTQVEVYLLRHPVASVADLESVAAQVQAAQPNVRAISAYVRPRDVSAAQPARLTRRFSLRTSPGQDVAALAASVGARVVEVVTYSPETVLCQCDASTLTAALDAAAALNGRPGVLFAAPLTERAATRR